MQNTDETNIEMIRGDTLQLGVELYDDDGNLIDDAITAAYFSCKSDPQSDSYVFQKQLNAGITEASTGKYRVRVAPEDTYSVEPGTYYFDMQIEIGSDVYTPLIGKLVINYDITREN